MVRRALKAKGIGYRLTQVGLPVKPDIVLAKYGAVIFVHGCFWHRHGCRKTYTPSSRLDFGQAKFDANVERDRRAHLAMRDASWRVATIWECGSSEARSAELADRLLKFLSGRDSTEFVWPEN